jgi:hypothetical protein
MTAGAERRKLRKIAAFILMRFVKKNEKETKVYRSIQKKTREEDGLGEFVVLEMLMMMIEMGRRLIDRKPWRLICTNDRLILVKGDSPDN